MLRAFSVLSHLSSFGAFGVNYIFFVTSSKKTRLFYQGSVFMFPCEDNERQNDVHFFSFIRMGMVACPAHKSNPFHRNYLGKTNEQFTLQDTLPMLAVGTEMCT